MIKFKRPILAAPLLPSDVEHNDIIVLQTMHKLSYPVLASLKMDGIRAIKLDKLVSRTLKPIPNRSIQDRALKLPAGYDMELWNPDLSYDEVESIVMSREHPNSDKISFYLLDLFDEWLTYTQRCECLWNYVTAGIYTDVKFSYPVFCGDADQLFRIEQEVIRDHGEGICFRTPLSPYKQGRSTLREQYLVKLCRYVHIEATIVTVIEQFANCNADNYNAVGMMDRSSCVTGLVGKNTLGAFLVRDEDGLEFRVGTGVGLTDARRKELWNKRDELPGKVITIKHKPHGMKVKPRSPVFIGFREKGF
jgi:DNA ligase-1